MLLHGMLCSLPFILGQEREDSIKSFPTRLWRNLHTHLREHCPGHFIWHDLRASTDPKDCIHGSYGCVLPNMLHCDYMSRFWRTKISQMAWNNVHDAWPNDSGTFLSVLDLAGRVCPYKCLAVGFGRLHLHLRSNNIRDKGSREMFPR